MHTSFPSTVKTWLLSSGVGQLAHEAHLALYDEPVFNAEAWDKHRRSNWRYRLQPVASVILALGFLWQLSLVLAIAVVTGLYHTLLVVSG